MVDILSSLINEADHISDGLIESMKEFLVGRDDAEVRKDYQKLDPNSCQLDQLKRLNVELGDFEKFRSPCDCYANEAGHTGVT